MGLVHELKNNFVLGLKDRLYRTSNKKNSECVSFSVSNRLQKMTLDECTIEDILPHLLVNSSMATIGSREKVWVATSMLVRFLETFTNNLVVMEDGCPVGMIGGHELIDKLLINPANTLFSESTAHQVMNTNLYVATPSTKIRDLLGKMRNGQRDFALIRNDDGEYSTISARRILEMGILCDTRMKVSQMPLKEILTFSREDNIGNMIEKMVHNNAEILVLEDTPKFVNHQIIFQKVVELNFLEKTNNFLELKGTSLNLQTGKIISDNTSLPEMCKTMLRMKYSFLMTSNNVLTPRDLVLALR